jgi:hypothetical protein
MLNVICRAGMSQRVYAIFRIPFKKKNRLFTVFFRVSTCMLIRDTHTLSGTQTQTRRFLKKLNVIEPERRRRQAALIYLGPRTRPHRRSPGSSRGSTWGSVAPSSRNRATEYANESGVSYGVGKRWCEHEASMRPSPDSTRQRRSAYSWRRACARAIWARNIIWAHEIL